MSDHCVLSAYEINVTILSDLGVNHFTGRAAHYGRRSNNNIVIEIMTIIIIML